MQTVLVLFWSGNNDKGKSLHILKTDFFSEYFQSAVFEHVHVDPMDVESQLNSVT